ncbi:acyltransferase family protein [Sediminispirochaeta smaragdinae]|uniref:Acyltransferase 3 domain-containing protein n=1 Tax=Sediminispirochaeta smaragdinae (strain DSM 11293 / JCM 15392 / SEBR 4228) TaxID=573413 RepID=E1R9U3_SEDSS|nr:acyltransferase family protein [Sediminispirochaeta smaragdinae]ADK83262.1 hypothetical protein Spirs_4186 [Sediminispirochaeta smaragdinae DSM 11293]
MEHKDREYYLDWLRVIVVALLIPHHAAITFSHLGDAYIYSDHQIPSLYYFIQSKFLNLWFMRLLFLVSGFSSFYALKKRNFREYLLERVKRLMVPLCFAIAFICPPTAYLMAIKTYHFEGNIIDFYPEFFKGFVNRYLGWGHLWFLAYLFVFSLILIVLLKILQNNIAYIEKASRFLSEHILFPMIVIIFLEVLLRPFFPGLQNLYSDWANFSVYLTFFLLGYLFAFRKTSTATILKYTRMFGILSLTLTIVFIYLHHWFFISEKPFPRYGTMLLALIQGSDEYVLVLFFIGMAKRYIHKRSPLLLYLSRTSFALYLFHYLILSAVIYGLLRTGLHHYVIFVISVLLTYAIFFILFESVIKRIGILRYVCGIKKATANH